MAVLGRFLGGRETCDRPARYARSSDIRWVIAAGLLPRRWGEVRLRATRAVLGKQGIPSRDDETDNQAGQQQKPVIALHAPLLSTRGGSDDRSRRRQPGAFHRLLRRHGIVSTGVRTDQRDCGRQPAKPKESLRIHFKA